MTESTVFIPPPDNSPGTPIYDQLVIETEANRLAPAPPPATRSDDRPVCPEHGIPDLCYDNDPLVGAP